MHEKYKDWHNANEDGNPLSIQAFGKRMNQLDHKSKKKGGIKKYLGLEIGLQDSKGVFLYKSLMCVHYEKFMKKGG